MTPDAPRAIPTKSDSGHIEIPPEIQALSLHSLRVELHRRHLPTTGLLSHLQARLASSSRPITVPHTFSIDTHLPLRTPSFPVKARGVLRHRVVWITGDEQMKVFWAKGQCGKGNLSRSAPCFNSVRDDTLKGKAMRQLMELEGGGEISQRANVEHLQLTLVEAYYAAFVEKRLVLLVDGVEIDAKEAWRVFCKRCEKFPWMFVAYARYRTVGWLPRSGLKYGVDWVLYPAKSRRHTHSPFCIVLKFGRKGEARVERSWIGLQNRLRLVKNVAKTLVITEVFVDKGVDFAVSVKHAFDAVRINELTIDRWIP